MHVTHYVCIYIVCICVHMYTYIHTYIHTCMHACMHACTYFYRIHMSAYIHTYIHTNKQTNIHIYIEYICMHTYIHTLHYITLYYITLHTINLPDLKYHLRQHHVTPDLPKRSAIGRDSDGTWRTAPLKEYPPAMNRAFACAFCHWFQRHPFCSDHRVDSNFLTKCRSMVVRAFGKVIGPDFGG